MAKAMGFETAWKAEEAVSTAAALATAEIIEQVKEA